jgi:hypothetical protein
MLGVTAWRLREAVSTDRGRALVHESPSGSRQYTPERLAADSQLAEGDRVRISVEPGAPGFLYIASREVYSDGTAGTPELIFPTTRIRGGRNEVRPGELIEIPEWNNPTPFLTIRRGKPNEIGERIYILLTKKPLAGITIASEAQVLAPGTVEDWARKWGIQTKMLDAPSLKGMPLTPAEQSAASQSVRLTAADPVPQVLFRVTSHAQDSILAEYPLRLRP